MIRTITIIFFIAVLLGGGIYWLNNRQTAEAIETSLSVAEAMANSDTAGYARAIQPRNFKFPEDHGPHPQYRTEWWYYTGNLDDAEGRHFGFQFTIFRTALSPDSLDRASDWASNQLYMGHFALTDVAGESFYAFEHFSRGALELAGAQAQPFRVWLEEWEVKALPGDDSPIPGMQLYAAEDAVALHLTLKSSKPPVLQGNRGLSQKGPEPGNASYYYSLTRIAAEGRIQIGDKTYPVRGFAWMDREWSTSALGKDQAGWDWFSLQLSDGRELMYYQLRRRDGSADRFSKGMLVNRDGSTRLITYREVELTVPDYWQSPRGGRYPARWRLKIPDEKLDLEITPYLADQELQVSIRYWEGAVKITGKTDGEPLSGNGYVELTGYGEEL